MTESLISLLDGIAGLPLWALVLAVGVVVAAESSLLLGLIVPGDLVVLLAASGGGSVPRALVLVLAVAAGSVAGEALGYAIGFRWGGRVRTGRLGRALGEHRWDRAGDALARHGGRAVFGARYVAAIHAVLPVAAGTLRMPVRKFLAWSAVGALSWATLYVSVGAAAGASFREAGENLAGATLAVVAVAALAAAAVWLRNHRRVGAATTTATTATTALAGTSTGGGTGGTGGSGVRCAAALASPAAGPCDERGDRRAA